MDLKIVPLAITMMAGPQIMSAIIFVTHDRPLRVSLPFIGAIALATSVGVTLMTGLVSLRGSESSLGGTSDAGSLGNVIKLVLVGLLIALSIRAYRGRETAEPPKWLGKLQTASPGLAFRTGVLLIYLMPADIVIMLTVAVHLRASGLSLAGAIPFVAATTLIAAGPLAAFLIFHRRAVKAIPKIRDWMNANSAIVNIIVYCFFIALILL